MMILSVPALNASTARLGSIRQRGSSCGLREMDRVLLISRFDQCRSLVSLLSDLEMTSSEIEEACAHRVIRAEIALGRWGEVGERLRSLPEAAAHTLLRRAELAFVQGDVDSAERYAGEALVASESGWPGCHFC